MNKFLARKDRNFVFLDNQEFETVSPFIQLCLASIAGSVFGLFVNMGIDSTALLTACVMSAPGSLAIAKMVYPEVRF